MSGDATALALEQNLALMAGAGAGKTYNLVTMCLHLLGGARSCGVPLRTSQLCMLTFTDKAAAEMRGRLRHRLDALARGGASEELLRQSFEHQGTPFPAPEFWRRTRDALGEASIGTFHSLCALLLRRARPGSGTDLAFRLLDEREALDLVRDSAERLVLEALELEDAGVVELCRELNFAGRGRAPGLVDHLCSTFAKIRDEGLSPEAVAISDPQSARDDFERALARVRGCLAQAIAVNRSDRGALGPLLSACQRALDGMTLESFLEPGRFPALRDAILGEGNLAKKRNGLADAYRALKQEALGGGSNGKLGLRDHYAGCLAVPHERALRSLLVGLQKRHRAELNRRSVLDFSELLIRARDLLRDHLEIRQEVQDRIRALLVDEFQDTNRLQLEMVLLLSEKREGAPRRISPSEPVTGLPLQPQFLCAVGDRKQSIYEFRGADVSVFELLARKIETENGRRAHLKENRRSAPALLEFFNCVFAELMKPPSDPRDYEVAYRPQSDDQLAVRSATRQAPCIDWVVFRPAETAEECRRQDAEAVAKKIRELLEDSSPLVEDRGVSRPARGGDIAILFRRFTFVEDYRQALIRHGVPHRIVRGRGFYGAQEVLDLASMLSLIADPSDGIAFAAVLRSPLVCLSDASLLRLAVASGGRLSINRAQLEALAASIQLPANELERLQRFLALYARLRRERDRLGIRALIRVALEETGYRVAQAGTPFGEQALANLDKLLELAARWDENARGGCAAFARELLALADADPTEAQADTLDTMDPRAVQLLTIHQAKGLEWRIVFVPDLAAQRNRSSPTIVFDRQHGLAIKPWLPEETDSVRSPRYAKVVSELMRREDAEYLRLLYVALTRARDHLVLSGQTTRQGGTWRALLQRLVDSDLAVRVLVRGVDAEKLATPAAAVAEREMASAEANERIETVLRRIRSPEAIPVSHVVLPVTQLQDYFLCPRRYLYAHRVGLSEYPLLLEIDEEQEPPPLGGRNASDRRQQGVIAHRLLQLADLSLVNQPLLIRAQMQQLLWQEGIDPSGPDAREIARWVERFLCTSFAERLSSGGEGRVHRELPFLLRLGSPEGKIQVHLKGQIDLLFEDERGGATVIDYKASPRHPAGLEPYAFQLDCYALAARHFVKEGVSVRTGITFLQQAHPEPEIRRAASARDLRELERRLVHGAAELFQAPHQRDWPGLPPEKCAAIRCGYQYRCHAATAGL